MTSRLACHAGRNQVSSNMCRSAQYGSHLADIFNAYVNNLFLHFKWNVTETYSQGTKLTLILVMAWHEAVDKSSYKSEITLSLTYILTSLHHDTNGVTVLAKNVGHVGHIWWLGPNVWLEISQICIEYITPIRQMSDESCKFLSYTGVKFVYYIS